jgi:hypothetical protein
MQESNTIIQDRYKLLFEVRPAMRVGVSFIPYPQNWSLGQSYFTPDTDKTLYRVLLDKYLLKGRIMCHSWVTNEFCIIR